MLDISGTSIFIKIIFLEASVVFFLGEYFFTGGIDDVPVCAISLLRT